MSTIQKYRTLILVLLLVGGNGFSQDNDDELPDPLIIVDKNLEPGTDLSRMISVKVKLRHIRGSDFSGSSEQKAIDKNLKVFLVNSGNQKQIRRYDQKNEGKSGWATGLIWRVPKFSKEAECRKTLKCLSFSLEIYGEKGKLSSLAKSDDLVIKVKWRQSSGRDLTSGDVKLVKDDRFPFEEPKGIRAEGSYKSIMVFWDSWTDWKARRIKYTLDGKTVKGPEKAPPSSVDITIFEVEDEEPDTKDFPGLAIVDNTEVEACHFEKKKNADADSWSCSLTCGAGLTANFKGADVVGSETVSISKSEYNSKQFSQLDPGKQYAVILSYKSGQFMKCSIVSPTINFSLSELNGADDAKSKDLRCFIATAAWGTPFHPKLDQLRHFRDTVLLTNPVGKAFVEFYYWVSPPIARMIERHEWMKSTVRSVLSFFLED